MSNPLTTEERAALAIQLYTRARLREGETIAAINDAFLAVTSGQRAEATACQQLRELNDRLNAAQAADNKIAAEAGLQI